MDITTTIETKSRGSAPAEAGARREPPGTQASLLPGSLWALAGYGVYAASQWALLVALARLGSPEMLGHYSLALALASPPLLLANLQLRSLAASDAAGRYPPRSLWRLRHRATLAGLGLVALVAALAGLGRLAVIETLLAAAIKALENTADLCHGVLQRVNALPAIAAAWWAKGVGSLVVFAAALAVSGSLWPALTAAACCHLAVLLAWEQPRARAVPPAGLPPGAAGLLPAALPLGVILLSIQVTAAAPRWLLERHHGAAALGSFAALQAFGAALQTAAGATAMAATARLAVWFDADRSAYFRSTWRLAALALAAGAAAVLGAPWLAALAGALYGPEYAGHGPLLAWLLAAAAIAGATAMTGTALTAARVFAPQAVLYLGAAAAAILYSWLAVAADGAMGAARSLLAAALVVAAGHAVLLVRLARRPR